MEIRLVVVLYYKQAVKRPKQKQIEVERMRKRKVLRTLGAVSVLALAFSFTTLADDASQFVTGTDVNGIVIGGLTEAEAKAKIEQSYASSYNLTIIEKDGKKENINGTEIGYRVTVPDNLKEILSQQNNTGRQSGPSSDNSHTLELQASYDEALLTARIRGLECINGGSIITTADSRISPYQEGQPFTIIPEVQGNNVDAAKKEAVIKAAAASGQSQVNLVENGCYYTVQVTKDNEQLKALCDKMNQSKDMVITYNFGENKEELTGAVFTSWFTGSEDGQIQVDRNAAAAYIAALAAKYDTAGTARVFHTATGKDVTLTGPYGWKLNQATEVEALIAMIRMGQSQTWEPQYTASAASRTAPDWGNTYVEIDLGGQHVYMIKDGAIVWDAPCVTGNVSKNYTTPEGIYSLTYKQTDRILRGAKQADGTYEYESHVDYWMPFNGGIGLHDADWRSKFGGTIYQYGGSHGCINLPPAKAKILYDLVYTGIPVICYN